VNRFSLLRLQGHKSTIEITKSVSLVWAPRLRRRYVVLRTEPAKSVSALRASSAGAKFSHIPAVHLTRRRRQVEWRAELPNTSLMTRPRRARFQRLPRGLRVNAHA